MFSTSISGPVAVIGDVHGQSEKLAEILGQLQSRDDFHDRWVVFIGDLVDRGPDSRGTLDMVAELLRTHERTTLIAGNHELAMAASLNLIETPPYTDWRKRWLASFGSEATFDSYGVERGDCETLAAQLPAAHADILRHAPWCIDHPNLFFVHAGLDPYMPFAAQRSVLEQRDFSLNSPGWLFSKRWPFEPLPADCSKCVISGHVPMPEVQIDAQRILVDTTGGVGGDLSCVLLPERTVLTSGAPAPARKPLFSRLFGRRAAAL
ncbi:MAG: metallophosphoesterase [Planctomyces sp.]|nr:metallophosphoesterase [Planctomyces sp.]